MNTKERNTEAKRVILPHLEIDAKSLPASTTRFTEALAAFIASPGDDVTGLRIYNLRKMAKYLKMDFERIEALLSRLDTYEQGAGNDAL